MALLKHVEIAEQIAAEINRLTGKDVYTDIYFEAAEPAAFFETCLYFDLLGYSIYTKSFYAAKSGITRQAVNQKILYGNIITIKCMSEKLNKLEFVAVREKDVP